MLGAWSALEDRLGKRPIGPANIFQAACTGNSGVLHTQSKGVIGGEQVASFPCLLEPWPFKNEAQSSTLQPRPKGTVSVGPGGLSAPTLLLPQTVGLEQGPMFATR